MSPPASLVIQDNGTAGSGQFLVQSGGVLIQGGEVQAVNCAVGGTDHASIYVSAGGQGKLTLSGDLTVAGYEPYVGVEDRLSVRNIFVGDPNSGSRSTVGSVNATSVISAIDTIHVYADASFSLGGGAVTAGTLHTYKVSDPSGDHLGLVYGLGTVEANTVNNEGKIATSPGGGWTCTATSCSTLPAHSPEAPGGPKEAP